MRIQEVRRLIQLVEESEIGELEVWKWWGRIRIRKASPNGGVQVATSGLVSAMPAPTLAPATPEAAPAPAPAAPEIAESAETENLTPIKSPMVGTFYRAPAPDAEPYVQEGQRVESGQNVCIIEAMKLMNEIQSEVRGQIVKILAENAQAVEFGQDLFLVKED